MKINTNIDDMVKVKVRGKNYPVTIAGQGMPMLAIGIGTLCQRTLSDRFKKYFKLYATDLYWVKEHGLPDPQSLTIDRIVDDITQLASSLQLPKFFIFAHSAYGIVALEFAKKYSQLLYGIIMSGTPPNSNPHVAAINNAYFEKHADAHRKMIDRQRREQFAQEDHTSFTSSERFLREYIWRDAPRYWYIPDFDCSAVWKDIVLDEVIDHFFATIMPKVDVRIQLAQVKCQVFLAAGDSDYDCCPFLWKDIGNLPSKMVISRFEKSGHWPHYEEQALFDERIENWLTQNFNSF